jgi:hypothetical protein
MQPRIGMLSPRAYPTALLFLIAAVPPLAAQSAVLPSADAPFASLAVAAAQATTLRREVARSGHASRLYTLVSPPRAASHVRTVTPVATPEAPDPPRRPRMDQAYWHDRMQAVLLERAHDQALLATTIAWARGFDQWPWDDAVTELTRRTAVLQTDTRAVHDLELEAHRAGVPPGWLVPE